MPARDLFHDVVKNALIKDGWTITDDPLHIRYGTLDLYIDLAAERLIGAEKAGRKIAVEIKSFTGASMIHEFHLAHGQYMSYLLALENQGFEHSLYLAVPEDTYLRFFESQFGRDAIERFELNLIVYQVESEAVVQWINKNNTGS